MFRPCGWRGHSDVSMPRAPSDDQALRQIVIYLRTWQAMTPDAHAHIVDEGERAYGFRRSSRATTACSSSAYSPPWSSGVHSVSCLVDPRALRSTDRLSGTFRTERSAPSSLVAVPERRLTELLRRPRPADKSLGDVLATNRRRRGTQRGRATPDSRSAPRSAPHAHP